MEPHPSSTKSFTSVYNHFFYTTFHPTSSLVSVSTILKPFTMIINYLYITKSNEFLSIFVLLQRRERKRLPSCTPPPLSSFSSSLQGVSLSTHPFISSLVENNNSFDLLTHEC